MTLLMNSGNLCDPDCCAQDDCPDDPNTHSTGCFDFSLAPASGSTLNVNVSCCPSDSLPDIIDATVTASATNGCSLADSSVITLTWDSGNSWWMGSGELFANGPEVGLTLTCKDNGFCLAFSGCDPSISVLADAGGACNAFAQTWSDICLGENCCCGCYDVADFPALEATARNISNCGCADNAGSEPIAMVLSQSSPGLPITVTSPLSNYGCGVVLHSFAFAINCEDECDPTSDIEAAPGTSTIFNNSFGFGVNSVADRVTSFSLSPFELIFESDYSNGPWTCETIEFTITEA